ncbi:MAG TPA: ABC transporter permease, partial [Gammaproteobacteria bacterium]|nr:ABC transporter permease [Gammaproteobacteria bacterium]
ATFGADTFVARVWREQARSLDGIEAYQLRDVVALDASGARVLLAMGMTPNLPAFLGVSPVLGREFGADDAAAGAPAVVLLSYETWQREYGGARDVLGRAITLNDVSHTVIGVMPARWDAIAFRRSEVWLPLSLEAVTAATTGNRSVEAFGRLRPEVPIDAVRTELDALVARAVETTGQRLTLPNSVTRVVRPPHLVGGTARDALLVVFAAVGLVLLVACSNVASLLLARGASRARELALRAALGASSWRLVRALLAECLVLALAAGAVGVVLGWLTLGILVRLRPGNLPQLAEVRLDPQVLAFTFGASVLTALLCGMAPALQVASGKLAGTLRHGAAGVVRGSGVRLRKALLAAQMAISVVLLVSAGLLVRSVIYLQQVDVGYDANNLFSVQLSLPRARYQAPTSRDVLAEDLLARIDSLPGVAGVTQAAQSPNYFIGTTAPEVPGTTLSDAEARTGFAVNLVRPDYFDTLGMRLLEGRTFTPDEVQSGAAVIVNRAMAQLFWPQGDAVGAEMKWQESWTTVVGVVDYVIFGGLLQPRDVPQFYLPFRADAAMVTSSGLTLIVRAAEDPGEVVASVRAATQALDPEIVIRNVRLTETDLAASIAGPRFNMALLTGFALIALVLAAVGLSAVIGYEVTERTHEIGVRMALGARTENVRRFAMRHGLTPALVGVAIGVIGALGATQLAASLLYGVAPRDPLTFVGVVVLLVLVALGASWLPARRATRVDPIAALRAD